MNVVNIPSAPSPYDWSNCVATAVFDVEGPYSFGTLSPVPNTKKEQNMFYDEDMDCRVTIEEKRLSYLGERLHSVTHDKRRELRIQFGLDSEETPRTPEEAVERIKAGRFTLKDKDQRHRYDNWFANLIWRDPKIESDQEGFDKAEKVLEKAHQDTYDTIMIHPADAGLEALKTFESQKFN